METRATSCSSCGGRDAEPVARARDYIYGGSRDYLTHVRCLQCEHVYLDPQPAPSALPIMYPPNYGTFSTKFSGKTNLLARVKTAVNLRRLRSLGDAIARGGRVLDVGCGNGELLLALRAARPDLRLTGIDWHFPPETRKALEDADITLIEAPLETAELPAGHFDVILMLQLIEHLWDPQGGVDRLARALAPGGRLLVETPNTDGYDRALFSSGTWGGYYVPRHLNLYNFERLAGLVERAGLEVVTQRSLPAPVIWCYSLQGWLRECFGQGVVLARFFELRNLPILAAFAALDVLVAKLGVTTSNQQVVATRSASPQANSSPPDSGSGGRS